MLKRNFFYKDRTVDEVIEKLYKDCCDNCDRLADSCRDFLYVANGYYNDGPLATKRYNNDKRLLDIYDRIRWIKEEFDHAKYDYGVRKHDKEKKEET